jgi:hypothetical protein
VRINRKQVARIRALEAKNAAQAAEIESLIETIQELERSILPDPPPRTQPL